jgi:SAM-dependent methyltransferase
MTNAQQAEHWNGPGGEHWVAEGDRYRRMLQPYSDHVLDAFGPQPGERILDVGCGNGDLTLAVAERVGADGHVLGVDLSRPMLANARRRARDRRIDNVEFVHGDAQVFPFEVDAFDGVVSRFGVMFFDDPTAAFANIARALHGAGRLAFVCWRDLLLNEYVMVPAAAALEHVPVPDFGVPGAPGPHAFADADKLRTVLSDAGFTDVGITESDEQLYLGSSVADVIEFFRHHEFAEILFRDVDPDAEQRAWRSIEAALQERATPEGISLASAAWLVTARRGGGV